MRRFSADAVVRRARSEALDGGIGNRLDEPEPKERRGLPERGHVGLQRHDLQRVGVDRFRLEQRAAEFRERIEMPARRLPETRDRLHTTATRSRRAVAGDARDVVENRAQSRRDGFHVGELVQPFGERVHLRPGQARQWIAEARRAARRRHVMRLRLMTPRGALLVGGLIAGRQGGSGKRRGEEDREGANRFHGDTLHAHCNERMSAGRESCKGHVK